MSLDNERFTLENEKLKSVGAHYYSRYQLEIQSCHKNTSFVEQELHSCENESKQKEEEYLRDKEELIRNITRLEKEKETWKCSNATQIEEEEKGNIWDWLLPW